MTDGPSKIIPNSFQSPNFLVDVLMRLLTGNEQKCVNVICRKTFGWQKRADRISKSQLMELTGLSKETVERCMSQLVKFHVVLRLAESVNNLGVKWSLQLDDKKIDLKGLEARAAKHLESNRSRTKNAIEKQVGMLDIPTMLDIPPGGMLDIPHKSHYQKPISSSSSTEPEKVILFYKQEIGKVTPKLQEKILKAKKEYTEELFLEAIEEAISSSSHPNLNYILAILKRWKQEGKAKGGNHANPNNSWSNKKRSNKTKGIQPKTYTPEELEIARRAVARALLGKDV